jgi:hypothetical protein
MRALLSLRYAAYAQRRPLTPQLLFLRKALAMDVPTSTRSPMQVPIRLAAGVIIECARGDDYLAAATSNVG